MSVAATSLARGLVPAGVAALLLPGWLAGGRAAAPRIVVGEVVAVSADRSAVPHVEPVLAAHPANPGLLFGAAVSLPDASARQGLEATTVDGFRSTDGGLSWRRVPLPACRIDPWVSFGTDDRLYLSCLSRESAVVLYRSADAGGSWQGPVPLPAGGGGSADRPVVVADRSPGSPRGSLYVVYGQHFAAAGLRRRLFGPAIAASADGGRTFSAPVLLRHDNLEQQPFDAVVLADGSAVVFFMDYAAGGAPLRHRRTWAITLAGGGRAPSTPALVGEQVDREMPWSAASDGSRLHRDRLYLAVAGLWEREGGRAESLPAGGMSRLYVISSDDRAETWSAPVAVTDGPAAAGCATPAIAVDGAGVVGLAWYDTRLDPGGECFDVYFSASLDGGKSFLPNVRVTPETSCPQAGKFRGVGSRWRFGGDYSGLAAGADGRFHVFWADSRSGVYQVATAAVRVVTGSVAAGGGRGR
ncbi:MAG TPA: hypothetical protein VHQ90_00960 [Thermoanaerobaculia bacterium]|nr:hypothetical protein [Thermoanaerobaculia bacterium]